MYRNLLIAVTMLLIIITTGCSSQSTNNSSDNESSLKDTASSAWHAVSFAMNITNPIYYAKKGAKAGYSKVKELQE